jgi:hypothetical protein
MSITGKPMTTEYQANESDSAPGDYNPEKLPPEVAFMLILIGIAAVPLPGPGVPFIVAGGLVLWPSTFNPLNNRIRQKYPDAHNKVFRVLRRFEADLNRRYPQ